MKSILVYLVPPTQKLAKTVEKSSKIALLWPHFPRNCDRKIGLIGWNCISFKFLNRQSFRLHLIHGRNANVLKWTGQKSKITNILRGRYETFFQTTFFRRIFWRRFWICISFCIWSLRERAMTVFLILTPTQGDFS